MTPALVKTLHNKHIVKCFVYIFTKNYIFNVAAELSNTESIFNLFGKIKAGLLSFGYSYCHPKKQNTRTEKSA